MGFLVAQRNAKDMEASLLSLQKKKEELLVGSQNRAETISEVKSYLDRIGTDISSLSILHVAGTKGKGSTCAFAERILREHGMKTGFYSSPHLISVKERIRINGAVLDDETFQSYFWSCYDRLESNRSQSGAFAPLPGYFRFLTILAFDIFIKEKVDVVCLEVGVGGRLDPTNVVPSPVAIAISSIGLDHQETLGSTLIEIASEKSGIIKQGTCAFTIKQSLDVLDVIRKKCESENVHLTVVDPLPDSVSLGLEGNHQRENAALACALASRWLAHNGVKECSKATLHALARCSWPGRCQVIQVSANLRFFIDGAHTPASMEACASWFFSKISPDSSLALLFNCSHTRDPFTILKPLCAKQAASLRTFEVAMSTPFDSDRPSSQDAPSIAELCRRSGRAFTKQDVDAKLSWQSTQLRVWDLLSDGVSAQSAVADSIRDSVERLKQWSERRPDVQHEVLVSGSLYLVGGILQVLDQKLNA